MGGLQAEAVLPHLFWKDVGAARRPGCALVYLGHDGRMKLWVKITTGMSGRAVRERAGKSALGITWPGSLSLGAMGGFWLQESPG